MTGLSKSSRSSALPLNESPPIRYTQRMLTLRSLGGPTVSCTTGQVSLLVFPPEVPSKPVGENTFILVTQPQETERADVISWPGEYDFSGMTVRSIGQGEEGQVSYVVTMEEMRIGFLSTPLREWGDLDIELLGDIDVLCIPSGDPKLVQKIIEEVDPRVLIPLPTDPQTYAEVLRICGAAESAPVPDVKLKKASLPKESREVYVLQS